MSKKKLFDDKTDWAILIFLVVLAFFAFSEPAKADVSVEYSHDSNGGITDYNSGLDRVCARKRSPGGLSFVLCPVVAVRGTPNWGSFEFGMTEELSQRWEGQLTLGRFDSDMYGGVTVRRLLGDRKFKPFIGLSYWVNESPGSNSDLTFNLGMRYTF